MENPSSPSAGSSSLHPDAAGLIAPTVTMGGSAPEDASSRRGESIIKDNTKEQSNITSPTGPFADPSIPPSDGHCVFFILPIELREMVYEYALEEPEGLYHHTRFHVGQGTAPSHRSNIITSSSTRWHGMEANQLKYVCKQLRHETKYLGFKHNTLTFPLSSYNRTSSLDCAQFLRNCPEAVCRTLRKVTIIEPMADISPGMRSIVQGGEWIDGLFNLDWIMQVRALCIQYPKLDITIRLDGISPQKMKYGEIMDHGLMLAVLNNGIRVLPNDIDRDSQLLILLNVRDVRIVKPVLVEEDLSLDNFHLFPAMAPEEEVVEDDPVMAQPALYATWWRRLQFWRAVGF